MRTKSAQTRLTEDSRWTGKGQASAYKIRPLILITDKIAEQRGPYSSLYLASLAVSDLVYETLSTANLSLLETKVLNISAFGLEIL